MTHAFDFMCPTVGQDRHTHNNARDSANFVRETKYVQFTMLEVVRMSWIHTFRPFFFQDVGDPFAKTWIIRPSMRKSD